MKIGVVDYGMGNLHSVAKALAQSGARVQVSADRKKLSASDILVLPGVGSFGAAMTNLTKNNMDDFIRSWIFDDKPFLGICLGLQLLFEGSEESPNIKGLGVMRGQVVRFRPTDFKGASYQVPHMGWNNPVSQGNLRNQYFKGISPRDYFYFVHTYFPEPVNESVVLTRTRYGKNFCSAVAVNNVVATQFHPEKSGRVGLQFLKNAVSVLRKS